MELLLIVVLALIVFGPAKLPEIMGQVGKAINDFRRATSDLSDEFNRTIQSELQEGRSVLDDTKAAVTDVHSTVNSTLTGAPAPTRTSVAEAVPTTNGSTAEPHAEGTSNGSVAAATTPPLADTSQWSWETAAPPPPPAPVVPPIQPAALDAVPEVSPATEPAPQTPQAPKQSAPEDLAPPY